jgi:hypothetical protein
MPETYNIREAFRRLREDDRGQCPFSEDLVSVTERILNAGDDPARANALTEWLSREQPCVFGRLSAQRGLIHYHFLAERTLADSGDDAIAASLQTARAAWKAQAEHGRSSALVFLVYGPSLARAAPDGALKDLALALLSAYLRRSAEADRIYTDWLPLWNVTFTERRRWRAGINFFGTQGDKRWWHDHRVPGGIAFSLNSVGHLVAAEARRQAVSDAARAVSAAPARARQRLVIAEGELAALQATSVISLEALNPSDVAGRVKFHEASLA